MKRAKSMQPLRGIKIITKSRYLLFSCSAGNNNLVLKRALLKLFRSDA